MIALRRLSAHAHRLGRARVGQQQQEFLAALAEELVELPAPLVHQSTIDRSTSSPASWPWRSLMRLK
jgi:hypothetical protein